jgi:hypothetical protein
MALFDDIVNGGNLWAGLAIGAGALIVWPLIGPVLRPIAKTAIKGGLIAYREAEQLYNDATQGIAEMAQEAQQEIDATTAAQSHTGKSTPSTI